MSGCVPSVRVVVADDHYLLREGLRALLDDSEGVEVVATAGSAPELLRAVEEHRPDAVITDVRMPRGTEGIDAAHELRRRHPDIGVVVLSQHADGAYAEALLAHGTAGLGYLLKDRVGDVAEMERALMEVRAGRTALDPRVVDALVGRRRARAPGPLDSLTDRERDVLREMARGLSNSGIGRVLSLSESAVEKHVGAVLAKVVPTDGPSAAGVHRRVVAVVAYLSGSS